MKKERITLLGTGDVKIDREDPASIFKYVADVIRAGDIAFANSEQMYSDKGYPNYFHGQATYSDPRILPAIVNAGFDVISLANNHTLDWGPEALLDTMARMEKAGLPYVGVGKNIAEARQPVILERKGNKVGFLAYGCIGPEGYEAGENDPGYAPIRVRTIYEQVDPQPATPPRIISFPLKEDLAAMVKDVQNLKSQVDVAVVSFHWGQHHIPRVIPMYCFDIGHAAVDAGADLILGGHAHILKGVEVYKGKVIFHSMCNFALERSQDSARGMRLPNKMRKIWHDHYHVREAAPGSAHAYDLSSEARNTIIVKAAIESGQIVRVSYIPCHVNKRAEPEIVSRNDPRGQEVFNYLQDISKSEGLKVRFSWEGDEVIVHTQN